jgi:hypothetical protein
MLTISPLRKYHFRHCFEMIAAQTIKIASQNKGSKFDGITKTVAIPIAKPNMDNWSISFQFMG